ncbi:hypothetical protein ABZ754_07955 [Micromonospora purpureochromogenes]|uniref:hypothetical protein n=1 Tax=Micromonospora purpureochromogenes TaxID=47872 RepID=UPI0033C9C386
MNTRRLATTGVALVAALGLLTGCGKQDGADTPAAGGSAASSSASVAPLDELTAAALKLGEDSVRVTITSSVVNGGGLLDPRTKATDMTLDMGSQGKVRMIAIGDDAWMKISGMAGAPKKWLHMDATKLGASGQMNLMPDGDPGGAKQMIKGVTEVERTGDHAFAGTLDYTKAKPDDKGIKALGAKAKAVPFTAKTDDQGRLIELVVDTSVLSPAAGKLKTTYTDFGAAVAPQKPPASQTQEAPEELIKAFGG